MRTGLSAELSTVVCDDVAKAERLLQEAEQLPSLKRLIFIGNQLPQALTQAAEHCKVDLDLFKDVEVFVCAA